jgi:6-phosphogluconolactonase
MRTLRLLPAAVLVWPLISAIAWGAPKGEALVYFGTYTRQKSKGIYVCRLDAKTGKLTSPELAAEVPNPSFLAVHPNRRFLYAVSEMGGGQKGGAVSAFAIDATSGKLTFLNRASSGGSGPCHLVVDKTGKNVVVVNYNSGSVAVFRWKRTAGCGRRLRSSSTRVRV